MSTENYDNTEHNDVARSKRSLMVGYDGTDYQALSVNSSGELNITEPVTVDIAASNSPAVGAFGRLRVGNPFTEFDSKMIDDNLPLLWDDAEVSGSGTTSTYTSDTSSVQLAVSLNTAGKRVRQTFRRFNYEPGKSELIVLTGVIGTGGSGITCEIGYFDDDNGLFFRVSDGTLSVVKRSSVTGSAVDTAVAQSSFNLDPLDGSGQSGRTLDLSKTQIFLLDYEWLGVGRVRMGFVIDGITYHCHEFLASNLLEEVYMSTPNLPLRYSIENDGTGAAAELKQICSTVITEGGTANNGILRYASTDGTEVVASADNTVYAVIGIRLKTSHIGRTILLQRQSIQIQTASEQGEWILIWNPTVAGSFTYSDVTNSAVQVATGATANTVTGGTRITGGYAESTSGGGGSGGVSTPLSNELILGSSIDGTVDEIVLCWVPRGGTSGHEVEGSLTWKELG